MKIQVTEKHIKNGEPRSCEFCPIALAIKEVLGENVFVNNNFEVNWRSLDAIIDGDLFCHTLPKEASQFIDMFDDNSKVRPLEFELDLEQYLQ